MTAVEEAPRVRAGIIMAALSALGLGLAVAVSRFAYEGGTDAITVAMSRSWLLFLLVWIYCLARGRKMRLPAPLFRQCLGLGLLTSMMFYGNIAAVQYISVSLAALLFFTFPPMIALLDAVVARRRPPLAKSAAVAGAFLGLLVMLGVSIQASHPVGLALSLTAAAAAAWNAVWIGRRMGQVEPAVLMLHMAAVAAVVLTALCWLRGGPVWPTAPGGWGGLLGVVTLQAFAVPLYFASLQLAGVVRAATFTNLQPVTSIAAAYLFFGEVMGGVQWLGGVMVLASLFAMQWADRRSTP